MLGYLGLLFFLIPIAEIAVLIQAGQIFGTLPTILAMIGLSVAGAWLAKMQGLLVWSRFMSTLAQGRIPSKEISDGALVLFGAALLLTPGFLTDFLGLSLLIPGLRSALKPVLIKAGKKVVGRRGTRFASPGAPGSDRVRVVKATVVPRPDRNGEDGGA